MPRSTCTFLFCLLLGTTLLSGATLAERTQDGAYYAGEGTVLLCDDAPRSRLPDGEPDEYDSPESWLFSGQPECVLSDVHNLDREDREWVAYGGYGWVWEEGRSPSGLLTVTTHDAWSGTGDSYIALSYHNADDERPTAEGCGPQSLQVEHIAGHWQGGGPPYVVWAKIPLVGVDADLTICFATTGHVQSTFIT